MAVVHIVDLNDALISWAMEKLGADYTVEKVDTSKVDVVQKAVLYQSTGDWWGTQMVKEEVFENDENSQANWNFSETIDFESKASWTLIKGLKCTKTLPISLVLEFPVAEEGASPLHVDIDCTKLTESNHVRETAKTAHLPAAQTVTVAPYGASKLKAHVRVCRLQNVTFSTNVLLSGPVKVQGHKKNKKWTKHELTASVVDALASKKPLGFQIIENNSDSEDVPARQIAFTVEGVCTGEVGVETKIDLQDLVTSV